MRTHSKFAPIHKVLIPFLHNGPGAEALEVAKHFEAEVVLIGIVKVPETETNLSTASPNVKELRKQLRQYSSDKQITVKSKVIVSHEPWLEFIKVLREEKPDLLCLEWNKHFEALGVSLHDVLTRPPCDVALVRGKFSGKPKEVLIPVRGGPHAELAVRVGLALYPEKLKTLHISNTDKPETRISASFKGLERVLQQMPEVQKQFEVTDDAAQLILDNAKETDIIILGTTSQPVTSPISLGFVADRILNEAPGVVIAVKSGRPLPQASYDESAGVQAISILVDKWFSANSYGADEFTLDELMEMKRKQGVTISLALPALNEQETVGKVITTIKRQLMEKIPLLDEIVLIDSDSTDNTREIARKENIPVYIHQNLLEDRGARSGKGEALWKSLLVTKGDIIVWIDTDIVNIHPRFVYGIICPMLHNPQVQFVKGFYRRPLKIGFQKQASGGGRVTELTARPLLNLFYPELSGVVQPLSGEYGGRRKALEQVPFFSGYGVETGLLIDMYEKFGLPAIAQVDLLERVHHNQHLEALSKMSFAIIQAVFRKLENRFGRVAVEEVNKSMKLIRHGKKGYHLEVEQIAEKEREPMIQVKEYVEKFYK